MHSGDGKSNGQHGLFCGVPQTGWRGALVGPLDLEDYVEVKRPEVPRAQQHLAGAR
jgi:hypothetical protein